MKTIYQLTIIMGTYWWTGTIKGVTVPESKNGYVYTTSAEERDRLNGKKA